MSRMNLPFTPYNPRANYRCRCFSAQFKCKLDPRGYKVIRGRELRQHREEEIKRRRGRAYVPTPDDVPQDASDYKIEATFELNEDEVKREQHLRPQGETQGDSTSTRARARPSTQSSVRAEQQRMPASSARASAVFSRARSEAAVEEAPATPGAEPFSLTRKAPKRSAPNESLELSSDDDDDGPSTITATQAALDKVTQEELQLQLAVQKTELLLKQHEKRALEQAMQTEAGRKKRRASGAPLVKVE